LVNSYFHKLNHEEELTNTKSTRDHTLVCGLEMQEGKIQTTLYINEVLLRIYWVVKFITIIKGFFFNILDIFRNTIHW
jgi:hypothetical protein